MNKDKIITDGLPRVLRAIYWLWLTVTAPLRLLVWVADAIIAVTAAVGICLVVAWFQGWLPDDVVSRYAQAAAAKITTLLIHAADVAAPGRNGPGHG